LVSCFWKVQNSARKRKLQTIRKCDTFFETTKDGIILIWLARWFYSMFFGDQVNVRELNLIFVLLKLHFGRRNAEKQLWKETGPGIILGRREIETNVVKIERIKSLVKLLTGLFGIWNPLIKLRYRKINFFSRNCAIKRPSKGSNYDKTANLQTASRQIWDSGKMFNLSKIASGPVISTDDLMTWALKISISESQFDPLFRMHHLILKINSSSSPEDV